MNYPERVLYVSYGSNMNYKRFMRYIAGGTAGTRTYKGARDTTPPAEVQHRQIDHPLVFKGESAVWTGGVGFLDDTKKGLTRAVGYLITWEQFIDVVTQENNASEPVTITRKAGEYILENLNTPVVTRPHYNKIVNLGESEGVPALTFTSANLHEWEDTIPSTDYLAMLEENL